MTKDKKLKEEEAGKKEHKLLHEVYKAGDKYHCGECGSEIDFGENCPVCNKNFNWSEITRHAFYR